MKRKLLSLTLVLALVLSMVPMGAFAAADQYQSSVSIDNTSITADGSDYLEFKISAYTSTSAAAAGEWIYVASSRGSSDELAATSTFTTPGADGIFVQTDATGKASVYVRTSAAGSLKLGAFLTSSGSYFPGGDGNSTKARLYLSGTNTSDINSVVLKAIGTKDVTASGASSKAIQIVGFSEKINGVSNSDATTGSNPKANGIDYYEYTFKVRGGAYTTSGGWAGAPVSGQVVKFYSNNTNVTFDKSEATSDSAGEVKVKVYATKDSSAGYVIEARTGNASVETKDMGSSSYNYSAYVAKFDTAGLTNIELTSDQNQKIAKDDTVAIDAKLIDGVGNQVVLTADPSVSGLVATVGGTKVTFENTVYPTGGEVKSGSWTYTSTGDIEFESPALSKEGNYTFRLYLENGKKIDMNFTIVKQGTITGINYSYKEKSVALGKTTGTPTLERVDAAGVVKGTNATEKANDFYFTLSDNTLGSVSNVGAFTATSDKDDIGKKVTVTAVDRVNKFSKSWEFVIGGKLSTVTTEAPASAEVGKDAIVKVSMVDSKGNIVSNSTTSSSFDVTTVVLEKPEGAIVGAEKASNFEKKFKEIGTGNLLVTSNKAGKVKLQVVATIDNVKYSNIVEVTFGAQAVVAAKNVVLTIGSKTGFNNNAPVTSDLAPFIQDGRTFVPVSFIAAQLGGTAEFTKNAAGLVDTVTVKVGTTTVTMTIGSTTIKVVKDGKESTVTTDVAPFIKSGRTVLPFRAVAEAFGAKVTFGPETGAVEWVKFEM